MVGDNIFFFVHLFIFIYGAIIIDGLVKEMKISKVFMIYATALPL